MTAEMRAAPRQPCRAWLAVTAAAAVMVPAALTAALAAPRAVALGALAGWLFCLNVTVGAAIWLLIGALTGGRWRAAIAPHLAGLARLTWLAALPALLFALAGAQLYPWWSGGDASQTFWLTPAFFRMRMAAVLVLWSGLGLVACRSLSPLPAALALCAHGIAVSVAGVDWVLSLDPSFTSTAFGAHLALLQLALALAAVAVLRPAGAGGDLGALLLACLLGLFYMAAMEFLVSWSGNLPDKAAWYLARQQGGGTALLWIAFGLGIALPFGALLSSAARSHPRTLRWCGAAMLAGGLAHLVWLVAPGAFAPAGLVAPGIAAAGTAILALMRRNADAR